MAFFQHTTGRHYGKPQVLDIHVPFYEYDANGDATVEVIFDDQVRGIAGKVTLNLWRDLTDDNRSIGAAVLAAYDAGRYATL